MINRFSQLESEYFAFPEDDECGTYCECDLCYKQTEEDYDDEE